MQRGVLEAAWSRVRLLEDGHLAPSILQVLHSAHGARGPPVGSGPVGYLGDDQDADAPAMAKPIVMPPPLKLPAQLTRRHSTENMGFASKMMATLSPRSYAAVDARRTHVTTNPLNGAPLPLVRWRH